MGLHRAGFEVIGFDIEPQKNYPFEFHQQDAFDVDLSDFDAVWASPPCQRYSLMNQRWPGAAEKWPDLVPEIRSRLDTAGRPYIIENVIGAPMKNFITLCGRSFGLGTHRHRKFETNWLALATPMWCKGWRDHAGVYGNHPDGGRIWTRKDGHSPLLRVGSLEEANHRMGIDWMEWSELKEAVPPPYSEFMGKQLIKTLEELDADYRRRAGRPPSGE